MNEGQRLISSKTIELKIASTKFFLNYYKKIIEEEKANNPEEEKGDISENGNEYDRFREELFTELKEKLESCESEYLGDQDITRFANYNSLKCKLDCIQHLINNDHTFTNFSRDLLWRQVRKHVGDFQEIEESKVYNRLPDDNDEIARLRGHLQQKDEKIAKLKRRVKGPMEESKSDDDLETNFSKLYNTHIPDANFKMTKNPTIDLDLSQSPDLDLLTALYPSSMPNCKDLAYHSLPNPPISPTQAPFLPQNSALRRTSAWKAAIY